MASPGFAAYTTGCQASNPTPRVGSLAAFHELEPVHDQVQGEPRADPRIAAFHRMFLTAVATISSTSPGHNGAIATKANGKSTSRGLLLPGVPQLDFHRAAVTTISACDKSKPPTMHHHSPSFGFVARSSAGLATHCRCRHAHHPPRSPRSPLRTEGNEAQMQRN